MLRTVSGPTDRVVVVGAGLSGLAAALHLAGAGRDVLVVEQADVPGGRAGRLELGGYSFDTGPTVLTMPDIVAETLGAVGEELDDWLELTRLDPAYRAYYADGSTLDVRASTEDMAEEIGRVCGPAEAQGYRRFVTFVTELYDLEMRHFIDRNLDSPLDLARPSLARLAALGGFRRLAPKVGQLPQGRAHPAAVLVPGDVRRALPVRRPRDLRGHRLHGLRRRRLLPRWRHARAAPRPGRRRGEARRELPVRRPRSPRSS